MPGREILHAPAVALKLMIIFLGAFRMTRIWKYGRSGLIAAGQTTTLCELFLLSCHFMLAFKPVDKLVFDYYTEFVY